jgi:hypothetical protein
VTSLRTVAAVALFAAAVAPARADFVLDDFSAPSPAVSYAITASNPNPYSLSTGIAGGVTRTATINVVSGVSAFSATGQVGGGLFELSTPAASTATATLSYAYASPTDFVAGGVNAISMQFAFADLNVPYSFVVRDADGATSTVTGLATSGPGTYTTALSSFSGVDLTRVSGFDIVLNQNVATGASQTSADFILNNVSVVQDTPPNPVPAPPAALLALAVLPAVGLRRVLRRTA